MNHLMTPTRKQSASTGRKVIPVMAMDSPELSARSWSFPRIWGMKNVVVYVSIGLSVRIISPGLGEELGLGSRL